MRKVGLFRSIHVKIVLIYVLLIIIAMQIIGLYFASKLEQTLKSNFKISLIDKMNLVEFSVREEMLKEHSEEERLETSLQAILHGFSSEDVNEIRVINLNGRILASQ